MKKFTNKLLAALLATATMSIAGINVIAEAEGMDSRNLVDDNTYTEEDQKENTHPFVSASKIKYQIFSNDDENFPLNFNIDVKPDSIIYDKLSEPVYGFEYALNEEKLEFDIIASLKNTYSDFEKYAVKITKDDESFVLDSEASYDSILRMTNLSLGETYSFFIKLGDEHIYDEFVGEFAVYREINNSITVDLYYQKSAKAEAKANRAYPDVETEPNNTQSNSDLLSNGISIIGAISSANDVDYYRYSMPNYVPGGIVNMDISLSVPQGETLKLQLINGQNGIIQKTTTSTSNGIHLRINNATLNTNYYIKISRPSGAYGSSYYLNVSHVVKDVWYGQFNATGPGVDYWNPNGLDQLQLTYGGSSKYVFTTSNNDWMQQGCGIASAAMILRNLGKEMNGYDFRINYSGNMMADPYTVMLANCNKNGVDINLANSPITVNNLPPEVQYYNIASKFGMNYRWDTPSNLGITDIDDLKDLIDQYKYVMVYFSGHWLVFSGYVNGNNLPFNKTFYVYDPAASSISTGANILLYNTTSGYSSKTFNNIVYLYYFY